MIAFLPNLGLGADPARRRAPGDRSARSRSAQFTAFYAYLLMLISPMRTLGYMLGAAQRATASGARIFQVLDREPRMTVAARTRRRSTRRPGGSSLPRRRADVRRRAAAGAAATSTSRSRPGRPSRWSARWVRARPRSCRCCRGCTTSARAASRSTAPTCASVDLISLRHAIAVVNDDPFLFSATVHDNIAYARPDATREEVERAAARRPGRRVHRAPCRRATTRSSASAG